MALVLLGTGCGVEAADASDRGAAGGELPGTAGTGDREKLTLAFGDGAGVVLVPRERRIIQLQIVPPAAYTVRFSLLDDPETSLPHDAALTRSQVVSDVSGRAQVELSAPSGPSKLQLRADVEAVWAVLPITVNGSGRAVLEVEPSYNGRRSVSEWFASVHTGFSCDELPAGIPADGQPFARQVVGTNLRLEQVELADKLAVVVRSGQFASGCTTLLGAAERGVVNVNVNVSDRVLQLSDTVLDVAFGLGAGDEVFTAALAQGDRVLREALLGGAPSELVTLLDEMQAQLEPEPAEAFALTRAQAGWDTRLRSRLFAGSRKGLLEAINAWSASGRSALLSARAFEGRLTAKEGGPQEQAFLQIDRVAELSAKELGFLAEGTLWEADVSDTLALESTLSWSPSELSAGLALAPAIAETGTSDVPEALASVLGCAQMGGALITSSTPSTAELVAACDATCLELLCRSALASLWQRARSASGEEQASLQLSAAGAATVGQLAQATSLQGTWVGRLTDAVDPSETQGLIQGWAPK